MKDSTEIHVPKENVEAFKLLYVIETGLREYIIEVLSIVSGDKWWKQRLQEDVVEKIKEGRIYQKKTRWTKIYLLHPIYYIDFPDLQKIIDRNDNWKDLFEGSIKSRKNILVTSLQSLEPIRNSVAHNRKITKDDLDIIKSTLNLICNYLGPEKFLSYANKCTSASNIHDIILELENEVSRIFYNIKGFQELPSPKVWESCESNWWFDRDYLNCDINCLKDFYSIVYEYIRQPRVRGSGHRIESFVKSCCVDEKYSICQSTLKQLKDHYNGSKQISQSV